MCGYGLYIEESAVKTKINFLAGLYRTEFTGKFVDFENSTENYKDKIKTNAFKAGISTLSIFNGNLVTSVDAYVKHYLDSKRKIYEEKDGNTKFEIDGVMGYKFNKDDDGLMLGLKCGYHNDLIDKGVHFGVSIGYIF